MSAQSGFDALAKSAAAAREAGNIPEALRDYRAAVSVHPDWQEGWWYLGTLEYDLDHYREAIPAFEKLLAIDPQNSAAWAFLGLSEFQTRDYDGALAHLLKSQPRNLADDPELARVARYHLALLEIRAAQFDDATSTLADELSVKYSAQLAFALGLASLRVPLLPAEIDPSREALLRSAGEAATSLRKNDLARAARAYDELVHTNPELPYLHYSYGLALEAAGKGSEALEQFEQEVKLSPQSPLSLAAIARIKRALDHPETAKQATTDSKPLAPETPVREPRILALYSSGGRRADTTNSVPDPALWDRAMQSFSASRYADAIADLKTFVITNPGNGTAWAVMGLSEYRLKDYGSALVHLERGNELGLGGSPDSVELAKSTLAALLNHAGQRSAAERLLSGETGSGPRDRLIQVIAGMLLLHVSGLPEELEPQARPLVVAAGEIYLLLEQSKYDEAFPKLDALIKQNPATPFLHYAYGVALASLSEYPEAEAQFREEARLSPESELPHIRLASLALRSRRSAGAVAPAKRAIELAPNSAEAHYTLGRAYLDLNQIADAVSELEMASKLEAGSPEIHFSLARAYARANRPERADEERATFRRLNALAEKQKSLRGNQSYGGSHDPSDVSLPALQPAPAVPRAER
ncbi:MAG TPA: tetratricopeptide repeat protein [Candidatus Saccharimonadales bacterium]|nr:tetratricopeptide repeat protein [Candidatus Saccharimonadales bacterium]